jgi:hypothetical protein
VHREELFGPLVIGLKIAITKRPSRRNTIMMLYLLKIPLSEAEVGRSIHLRSATHKVMATGLEGFTLAVEPGVLRNIATLLENLRGIPVFRLPWQPVAPLQDQHLETSSCQLAGQGTTTGTTADNQHIHVLVNGNGELIGARGNGKHGNVD